MDITNKWVKVNVERETYARLVALARASFRSVPSEIGYLVDRELAGQELAEARQIVAAEPCEETADRE